MGNSNSNNSFSHAFLPGLILGLIIGAVAGAILPDILGGPKLPAHIDNAGSYGGSSHRDSRDGEMPLDEETQKALDEAKDNAVDDIENAADDAVQEIDDAKNGSPTGVPGNPPSDG